MNDNKKIRLINILVICLYFIWPYFLGSITNIFKLSTTMNLYVSFSVNFVFLLVIVYIYKDILNKYYNNFIRNYKKNILNSFKIFLIGLFIYVFANTLLGVINIPILNNQSSMIEMFKVVPILFILNTLFYYPVIEEIVFKMSLKNIFNNKWIFVIVTGLLNAFFQIVFSITNVTDLLYLLPCTFFFSSLSYMYYETDNIMYPILFRVCYNLIPCIIYIIDLFV